MKKTLLMAALAAAVGRLWLEGTRPIIMYMEGTPPLRGVPYPTL
jgi:hypothetical protein